MLYLPSQTITLSQEGKLVKYSLCEEKRRVVTPTYHTRHTVKKQHILIESVRF
jgi:hypothetical protein